MKIEKGDEVVTVPSLWHFGVDIGERLGKVVDTSGHILVEIYEYNSNPVKLMRNEVEVVTKLGEQINDMDEIERAFKSLNWGP